MNGMTSKLWKQHLEYGMFIRLCECNNKRSDIVPMARIVKKVLGYTKEDALIYVLEWMGDLNGQFEETDLTEEEYDELLSQI